MKKGFKAFNKDMTCRGFKFAVGETYSLNGPVQLCSNGFHYCENAFDVYNYYDRSADTLIAEVEDLGNTVKEGDKSATDKLRIVRLLSDAERLELWINRTNSGDYNSGDYNSGNRNNGNYNSGDYNSGNRNSGDYNSGDYNSGNRNSGNYNSGNRNSGNRNSGDYNSGNRNSGNRNSGNYNSGNRNSGNYNSGDYNSGAFNTTTPKVRLFNKDTDLTFDSVEWSKIANLPVKPRLLWVPDSSMTESEKGKYPSYKTTGGFLKDTGKLDWSGLSEDDLTFVKSLPGFDPAVFREISGIDLSDTVEVTVNGKTKRLSKDEATRLGLLD